MLLRVRAISSCAGRARKAITRPRSGSGSGGGGTSAGLGDRSLSRSWCILSPPISAGQSMTEESGGKARMAAVSAFLIAELWKARWLTNEETLDISDMTEILYRYSPGAGGHSDLNLERMERIMERRGIPWIGKEEGRYERL